jgi:hypothetical protein
VSGNSPLDYEPAPPGPKPRPLLFILYLFMISGLIVALVFVVIQWLEPGLR